MVVSTMRWLLALHLLLSPLIFSTRTVEAFETSKVGLLLATALLLGALGITSQLRRTTIVDALRSLREDWLALGFVLLAVSAFVSTIFSVSPLLSWRGDHVGEFGLRTVLAYLVLFFATRHVCRTPSDALPLLVAAGIASVLTSAYALVQWAGRDPLLWTELPLFGTQFRPFGTLGHPNSLGAYLALVLPLLGEFSRRACAARRWVVAGMLVLAGALVCSALVLTLSRAAWLATGCMVVVLAAGYWLAGWRRWAVALGLMMLIGAVCVLPAVGAERLRHLSDGQGRYPIWRAAWRLFLDRPLCGWGTDAFRLAFGTRRPTDYWLDEGSASPAKVHNELLHLLATQGLLGATAALVLLTGLARAILRTWRRTAPGDRPLLAALVAGIVAFFVQGLFGFIVAGVGTLFVTLTALLAGWGNVLQASDKRKLTVAAGFSLRPPQAEACGYGQVKSCRSPNREDAAPAELLARARQEPRPPQSIRHQASPQNPSFPSWIRWPGRAVVIGAAGLGIWFTVVVPFQASKACADGDHLLAHDPASALACYERAVSLDPDDDRTWIKLSAAAQFRARNAGSVAEWEQYDEQALHAADRAVALVPIDSFHRASRARWLGERAFLGKGSPRAALDEWTTALSRDPDNAFLLAEAGRTALALGERESGLRWLRHGLALYPKFSPFQARLGTLALADGRLDEARVRLETALALDWQHDPEDRTRARAALAATYLALRQYEAALAVATIAEIEAPSWPTPPLLLAQALEQLGRRDEAADAYRRILSLQPTHAAARLALARLQSPAATAH